MSWSFIVQSEGGNISLCLRRSPWIDSCEIRGVLDLGLAGVLDWRRLLVGIALGIARCLAAFVASTHEECRYVPTLSSPKAPTNVAQWLQLATAM